MIEIWPNGLLSNPQGGATGTQPFSPDHEEIIISCPVGDDGFVCSFLMSQLPADCQLRAALENLLAQMREITEHGAPPNGGPAERVGRSDLAGGPPSVS